MLCASVSWKAKSDFAACFRRLKCKGGCCSVKVASLLIAGNAIPIYKRKTFVEVSI